METLRTFIAVELDKENREALERIEDDLKRLDADVKWVDPQNIHLTLKFLGEIPPKKVRQVQETLPELLKAFSLFEITIATLGAFPKPERPRIIWVGVTQNAHELTRLAHQVEEGLCALSFPKEEKAFSPHATIGRVRSPKNQAQLAEGIKNYSFAPLTQKISKVILFKSTLTPQGPIYQPLAEVSF
jgi:RNA 2',3'-cyclic 3'-phosphodiesterase